MLDCANPAFSLGDVLVTRTDGRGVILSGNRHFERVSGYDWSELKGAPHKIVRHPDMPRAVFHLMWETLKRGEPISAFVKNQTKTGGFYWVFATIIPVGDGFLSVRCRPTDDVLNNIAAIYQKVRAAERKDDCTPEESLNYLRSLLRDEGHRGYWDFMARYGAEQWIKRNADCKRPPSPVLENLLTVLREWDQVTDMCNGIMKRHDAFETSPLNLRIQAAQLGDNGRALDVIASSFTDLARQIRTGMEHFAERVEKVSISIRKATYLRSADHLMREAEEDLRGEVGNGLVNDDEADLMLAQSEHLAQQAKTCVEDVVREFSDFSADVLATKRNLTGLSLTRVMSAIENAQQQSGSVTSIIEELRKFQEFSDKSIREVQARILVMQGQLRRLN